MRVEINGEPVEVAASATVADAVARTGALGSRGLAVAVDGEVVPRSAWAETPLREDQRIEIVVAVQGG